MSENMIEKCARAAMEDAKRQLEAVPGPGNGWHSSGGTLNMESIARAVLDALMEPTEAMIEALLDPDTPFVGRRTMDKRRGEVVELTNDDWRTTVPADEYFRHHGYFASEQEAMKEAERLTAKWKITAMISKAKEQTE